ncbi:MAG TPA: hypothetical protein VF558_02905, partial [Rubrobacteraceae bacterium]
MLVVDEAYKEGLGDIEPGQRIVVIFNLHEGPASFPDLLRQMPPHRRQGPPGVDSSMGLQHLLARATQPHCRRCWRCSRWRGR